ncbi:unnamed protein product [Amoebophrya sp. A25]|nr:unnamed protein product [Amoebophrya sp. A25]|eukprot:GSA25T00009294001.1
MDDVLLMKRCKRTDHNGADVDAENQKDDGDVAQHDEADEDTVRNEDDGDVAQDKEADEGEVQEQEIVDLVVDAPVFYKEGLQERLVPEIHEQQTEQDLQAQRVVPEIQDINMIGEYEDEQKNQGPPRELMEEVELQPQDDDDKVEDDVDEEKVMFYDLEDELDNYGKNAGDKDSATAVFSLPGSRKNTQEEVREQEEYDHEDEEDVAAQRPSRNPHVPEQQLYDEDATTSAQSATPSSARFRLEQEHGNASPPTSSRAANLSPEESNDEDGNASAEEGSSQRLEDAVSLHLDDDTDNEEEFVARANEQRRYAQSSREAIKEDDGENDDQSDTDIDEDSDASQLADSDSSRLLFQKNIPRSQCQTSANIILEDKRCTSDIKIGEKKWRWKPALSALKNKCRGLCRDKTLCKSFAVRQNLGRCYLYKSKMTAATIDNHCTLSWPTGKIYNLICPTTSTTTSTTTPGPVPATTSSSTAPSTTSSSTAPSTTSSTTAPSTTSSSTTAPSTTRSSSTTAPSTTSSSTALPTTTASTSTTDPITPLFATLTATTTITSTSTTTTTLPPLDLNTCEASPAAGNTITRGAGATCEDGEYQDATDPVETESEKTVDDYGIIAERDDCLRKCKLRVEALGDEGACRSFGVLGEFCRLYAMPFDEASCVPNWGTEGNNALIYDMVCQRQKSGGFSVVIGGESR